MNMKIKLQKLVTAIVVLGSFATLISNTVIFRAYVIQNQSVLDQNNIIPEMTIEEAVKNDLNYPNINIYKRFFIFCFLHVIIQKQQRRQN